MPIQQENRCVFIVPELEPSYFMCFCGEMFDALVWHCPKCHHHWPMSSSRQECANCHDSEKPDYPSCHPFPSSGFEYAARLGGGFVGLKESGIPNHWWVCGPTIIMIKPTSGVGILWILEQMEIEWQSLQWVVQPGKPSVENPFDFFLEEEAGNQ